MLLDLHGELVHVDGFGLLIDIGPDDHIVGIYGQTRFQSTGFKYIVHDKHHHRFATLSLFMQDLAELREAPSAIDHLGNHFKISKHVVFLFG